MHLKERCDCLSHDVVTLNVDRNVSNTYCWSSSGEDFKYTCVYYSPLSSEEDKQYVVETSRTTSKVTTSCGKRLYFSFESVIYHDDLPNRFTIYHPNGWQISPPPPPPAPIQKTINTESIIGKEKGSEVRWGSLKGVFRDSVRETEMKYSTFLTVKVISKGKKIDIFTPVKDRVTKLKLYLIVQVSLGSTKQA